jgi:hypothetical protein
MSPQKKEGTDQIAKENKQKITMWTILIPVIATSLGFSGGNVLSSNNNTDKVVELEKKVELSSYQIIEIKKLLDTNSVEHKDIMSMLNRLYYKDSKTAMKE